MKANVQMRINTFCKLLQNEFGKILLSGFISERIFLKWTTFWCFQAVISERIFKKSLLYLENYMSCIIWFHRCHNSVNDFMGERRRYSGNDWQACEEAGSIQKYSDRGWLWRWQQVIRMEANTPNRICNVTAIDKLWEQNAKGKVMWLRKL